jgi:hypothetical protein
VSWSSPLAKPAQLVAWEDVEAIRRRIMEHWAAGADYACMQVFDADPHNLPVWQWGELAHVFR